MPQFHCRQSSPWLLALFALADGDKEKALALSREAVVEELALPFRYGPPRVVKPAAELLGDVLFQLGLDEEAVAAYTDQLTRTPRRTNSILGLARAGSKQGDRATAVEAYRQLMAIWHDADSALPGLAEARSATADN